MFLPTALRTLLHDPLLPLVAAGLLLIGLGAWLHRIAVTRLRPILPPLRLPPHRRPLPPLARPDWPAARRWQRARGQVLPLVALIIGLFLLPFVLVSIEWSARYQQQALIRQAMQQSTRSAVQTFDYDVFAGGTMTTRQQTELTTLATQIMAANLDGVWGLQDTPANVAALATWTILPNGGTCTFANGEVATAPVGVPLVCGDVTVEITGAGLTGPVDVTVHAADQLDIIQ